MKCKHTLEEGTCSLCLGYKQQECKSGMPQWFLDIKRLTNIVLLSQKPDRGWYSGPNSKRRANREEAQKEVARREYARVWG